MVFYGWNHVIEKILGTLSEKKCEACDGSYDWKLIMRRTFFTLFFVPIFSYQTQYYLKCEACSATKSLEKQEARNLIENHFPQKKARLALGNALRYCALLLAAATFYFVVKGGGIEGISADIDTYIKINKIKSMVDADGEYIIYNPDGELIAEVSVEDGEKRIAVLYEYYDITEDVPEGHEFYQMYYYYEREKGKIDLYENNCLIICDDFDVGVRYHFYDSYEDEMFWYYGMDDFDDIDYGTDRTIYPMEQYVSDTDVEYYSKIRVDDGLDDAVMTFYHGTNVKDQNTLALLDISLMDEEVNSKERMWFYQTFDIDMESTFSDVTQFIEENEPQFDYRDYQEFYGETGSVIEYRIYEWVEGDSLFTNEYIYDVSINDKGYYVARLIQYEDTNALSSK